jgi:hypothetical protein
MSNRILFEMRPAADAASSNRTPCTWRSALRVLRNPMKWSPISLFVLLPVAIFLACVQSLSGQVSVLTWHYDNQRSSVNQNETLLTPANVNTKMFAKLYTQPVDGYIVGHPLYVPGLYLPPGPEVQNSGIHNVVFVATMHDSVFAFDADNPALGPLWMTSLFDYSPAGATTVNPYIKGCDNEISYAEVGIVSTPVIDPSTNTMYVVTETYENSQVVHRLHALDITSGLEVAGWPVTITANFVLNGQNNVFLDQDHLQRTGLLLANGHVYIAWTAPACDVVDEGWIMSYNTTTGAQEGVFDPEPGAYWAGLWQRGAGLSADSDGNIYGETGEGRFVAGTNFPISVIKLSQIGTEITVADWFTPYNEQYLSDADLDLNSGVLVLPEQPGPYPDELITSGKQGTIYVLNSDNMGQFCSTCTTTDNQIIQELPKAVGAGPGIPVLWNGTVYFNSANGLSAFALNNGILQTPPNTVGFISTDAHSHGLITSNGATNGIYWSIANNALRAINATTLQILYTSVQAPNQRDVVPPLAHFAGPIEADGKVFVGTQTSLVVYGLLPQLTPAAGNNQSGTVGTTVAITAQAVDPYSGNPYAGVSVTFSDGGKGGKFSTSIVTTDVNGNASTNYTLPTKSGTYTLSANASGYYGATFLETAVPGPPGLHYQSGMDQTTGIQTTFPSPLVATVRDQYNDPFPGVAVSFSDGGKGGQFSVNPATTDQLGQASVSYTTSTVAGRLMITASSTGLNSVNFLEIITPGPASNIVVVSGNNQTGVPSTLLGKAVVVKVTDQYGNAVPGASVTYTDNGAGGSFSANPVVTNSLGEASVQYTAPPAAETVFITASLNGGSPSAQFTENVQ